MKCDDLSAAELSALSSYELAVALNEVIAETALNAKVQREARDRVSAAKIAVLRSPSVETKAERIVAETLFQHARDRAATLKQYSSITQSLLRAAQIV